MSELKNNEPDLVEYEIRVTNPDGTTISVQFLKTGYRYRHQWVWHGDGQNEILLHTGDDLEMEGRGAPLQQVVQEVHGESDVILAVGQAGKNHWSGSIRQRSTNDGLDVEFACRVNQPVNWLGSFYQIGPACRIIENRSDGLVLECRQNRFALNSSHNSRIKVTDRTITIRPVTLFEQVPDTITWTYSFGMDPQS